MKIPKRIKVAGHVIRVKFVTRLKSNAGKEEFYGKSSHNRNEVIIARKNFNDRLAEEHIASTFLHEVIHQVDNKYNVKLSEKQTTNLEIGLFQVLRDNKLNFGE